MHILYIVQVSCLHGNEGCRSVSSTWLQVDSYSFESPNLKLTEFHTFTQRGNDPHNCNNEIIFYIAQNLTNALKLFRVFSD